MIKKVPSILLWMFVIALQIQFIYQYSQPKDVVIDVEEVFNEFLMKQELEQKAKSIEQVQKVVVDSLEHQLAQLELSYNQAKDEDKEMIETRFNQLGAYYQQRTETMEEQLVLAVNNFDEQIWNQLNAYLVDYGKEKGVQIIFGRYQKSIMYQTDEVDKTREAILFVNNRYKGF